MALSFPNPSRSYDAARHCVSFWGYDNTGEITFVIDEALLSALSGSMKFDESSVLAAFDRHRDQILTLARKLYSAGRQNKYTIC